MATVYGVEISQPPPKQWTAYNSCYNNSINSGGYNVYTTYSTSSIGVSVTLYSDNNLLTTLSNQLLSYNNTWYMTAENGTIISSLSCGPSIPFTVYGNCSDAASQTNSFTIYISNFYNALDDGAIIYSDSNLTTPHTADIIYNGMVYSVNFDGMIVDSAVCGSVSWTMFNTCSDYKTNTNPVTIYTAFTNNITLGTVLYVDSGLTITQNGNVIYNGNILSPDSGTIVYINPCVLSWTAYNSCSAYENATNSFELYTNSSDNSLQVGATVYSDINTNVPRTVTFINNSTIFDVNGSGAITDLTKCLYQFNANDTACGLANNVIYYTDHLPLSIGISYVYTSNGNTPASNATIYVYGDSSYYTTDAGGIVNAINTCPS
jgi:hypothetical protein